MKRTIPDHMTHRIIVQAIAETIRSRYVFANTAERVASHLLQQMDSGAYDTTDATALATRLTDDLRQASGDLHLRVRHAAEPHVPETPGDTVREQNDRAEHCRKMGFGIASVHRLDDDIAVIDIRELVEPELSRSAFETALTSVADASALVIDLRRCVGGDPSTVGLICAHLLDHRTQLSSMVPRSAPEEHFWADPTPYPHRFGGKKPLYIAVAKFTFSGAEMLAYDLQAMGRAVVVGETTGGGAHGCLFHWPSPHFSLLLAEARPVNPITADNWERVGVTPDVPCSEEDALRVAAASALRAAK
jgi:C-terminal processing protease CtpA/Prc